MRTLLYAVLLGSSSLHAEAPAQSLPSTLVDNTVSFDLRMSPRTRIEFRIDDLRIMTERYRYSIAPFEAYRIQDTCVTYREWSMITPFQDCSHRSLRRGRPMIRLIYVF